jgi:segregation and condensation protein A
LSFEIKLPLFEGPFDLLLFFIERNEIDIYDIPIAQITEDFLAYLTQLEELNIEVASEFILVAATLMRIKAKMLIPKDPSSENPEDPRQELVNYLLEYKKYKSVLEAFADLESEQFKKEPRGNLAYELQKVGQANQLEIELQTLDLYKLLKVYENVIHRFEERSHPVVHTIVPYAYTVEGQKEFVLLELKRQGKRISFVEILGQSAERIVVIFNFLAILELLQNRLITLQLGEGFNNFWIEENPEIEVAKQ